MSFFASLPSVAVPARRFDTFVDALISPDNSGFRIAIRRLVSGEKTVVSSIISPLFPLAGDAVTALAAVIAYGGSPSERRTVEQIRASAARCPRTHPAAAEVLSWRQDGALPAWEASRERTQRADDLDAITGAKPAAGTPFQGRKLPAAAPNVEHDAAPVG